MVTADAWNDTADTFQTLETSATIISDGCKLARFVGSVAVSGGTAGFLTSSTLAQATVVVTGKDFILEVTDHAASIAFGNDNDISLISNTIRTVTEPVSSILGITQLETHFDTTVALIHLANDALLNNSVLGIQLKSNQNKSKYTETITISNLKQDEVKNWHHELSRL